MEPSRIHTVFLGTNPSETHTKLYANFPRYRGFSSADPSREAFEATFIVALMQATGENGKFNRSYLFVPATKVAWVNELTLSVARVMFARWKGQGTPEARKKVVEHLGQALKHLMVGSRVLQMEDEPARWTALGFQAADPIPEWMRSALLSV